MRGTHCVPDKIEKDPILHGVLGVGGKRDVTQNKSGVRNREQGGRQSASLDRKRLTEDTFDQSPEWVRTRALGNSLKSFPSKGSSQRRRPLFSINLENELSSLIK